MEILLYEMGLLGYVWLLIPAILILPVVLASLLLCAPKWMDEHPGPEWMGVLGDRIGGYGERVEQAVFGLWIFKPIAYVGNLVVAAMFGVICLPFALGLLYIQACVSVIEGACPYSHDSEWNGWMRNQWKFLTTAFEPSKWDQKGGPLA